MDVFSGVTTTAAFAVVYMKCLLWCIEEMDVVSGVTTTAATAVVYLKGLLWSGEEMAVVQAYLQQLQLLWFTEGPPLE